MPDQAAPSGGPESGPLPTKLAALLREVARPPGEESAPAWVAPLAPGAVVGRFELVRELGRGGFGVVYEARDRELGRSVAFKAVRPGRRAAAAEERLLAEATAAARLSHPNIVTLHDVGRSEQGPFLVLELLQGQSLARRIEQGPLPVVEALRIAVEVAKGVAYAHAHGVIHRDLTPGNVFLCQDGQVKVLDLGMAHAFGHDRAEGGTPGYMAPEQERGAPEDERTDVFALGVILYRLLASEPPFSGPRRARAAPVLEVSAAPALGGLVARMLALDPVERPRSCGEVLDALSAILAEVQRAPASEPAVARRRRLRSSTVALVGAGVLLGAAAAGWLAWRARPAAPDGMASIAVLPFADLSPQRDQEYFSDGLSDEILGKLARLDGIRVPSRTSSFFFKGKGARLADIGRELNVRAVLEGSVRRLGSRVRVSAQIVSVADDASLWSETYDRELADIFAVQEEIARAVVQALAVKLRGRVAAAPGARRPTTPEAYAQVLLGRHEYQRLTWDGFRLAVEAYQRAIDLDPGYAPAWAGLSGPLFILASQAGDPAAILAQRRRAHAAADRAVELAPDLPEALSARAGFRASMDHDWAGARADLERALALGESDPETRRRHAYLLLDLGQFEEAVAEGRRAADLDPLGPSVAALAALHQYAGELEPSEAAYRRYLRTWPDSLSGRFGLGTTLLLEGKAREALEELGRLSDRNFRLIGEALAEHTLGHARASQAALDELTAGLGDAYPFSIAEIHAWRGEREQALRWLERAIAASDLEPGFRWSPFLRSVREDPRFLAMVRGLGLPAEVTPR